MRAGKKKNLGKMSLKGYSTVAFVMLLLTHSCTFWGDGFGLSRHNDLYDHYDGNMSYTEIPARITIKAINENPSETYAWEVLQFGCNMKKQQEIIAEVHEAGIPKEQIQTIFYAHDRFDAPLETGKTYFMKLDIHANYYSFLFKSSYGFGVHYWQELNSEEEAAVIEPYVDWKWKFVIYAIACWLQIGLFITIIYFAGDCQNSTGLEKKTSVGLSLIFLNATLWIAYVDSTYMKDWSDNIIQIIAIGLGLTTLGASLWAFRKVDLE
jgi:hypothetical protein